MKKFSCSVCGYEHIGDSSPEKCPLCKASGDRFSEVKNEEHPKYFYINNSNEQAGPIPPTEFGNMGINRNTLVWRQGMSNWLPAGQLSELTPYLGQYYQQSSMRGLSANAQQRPPVDRQQQSYFNRQGPSVITQQRPDNFMVWAILSTIFCCLATGIVAIYNANKVDTLWYEGKQNESIDAMKKARMWTFISAGIGLIGYMAFALYGPGGYMFYQILLLLLWGTYVIITGIGSGASPVIGILLWIGGIIFLSWILPIVYDFFF